MSILTVSASGLRKDYGLRQVFSGVDFNIRSGMALGVVGKNGSGKSTLLKIAAGLLSPTSGALEYAFDGKPAGGTSACLFTGMVAPYLQLYEEFTAGENLGVIASIRGERVSEAALYAALAGVGLEQRTTDLVREYSSGMKQRLKYAAAALFRPALFIVDEPRTNLDTEGINIAREIIMERKRHAAVLIATNDDEDRPMCDTFVTLGDS